MLICMPLYLGDQGHGHCLLQDVCASSFLQALCSRLYDWASDRKPTLEAVCCV